MEKIVEALRKLLPENEINEVSSAVQQMLEQAKLDLETEFNEKLEEAYGDLSSEVAEAEKIAEAGYEEAYAIIADLRNRLEIQGEEYKAALEEGYEEAYEMLTQEKGKNQTLEVEMYEEYDKKLSEMKEYIVDKVDQFLQFKGQEIYEQAKLEIVNDPRMAEHKVALNKIVDITANYLSDDDFAAVSSNKVEEANKKIEEMKGQLRIMEARNIRVSTENTKLNETVRHAQEVINESRKAVVESKKEAVVNEQKERTEKAKNVTGRGRTSDGEVVSEYASPNNNNSGADQLLILSGLKQAQ